LRDRRLGDEELLRCGVDTAFVDDGEEVLELPDVHAGTLPVDGGATYVIRRRTGVRPATDRPVGSIG
jgi:hypothetical protein